MQSDAEGSSSTANVTAQGMTSALEAIASGEDGDGTQEQAKKSVAFDENTKQTVRKLPLIKTRAGPADGEAWKQRLKEEYMCLIQYVNVNKERDSDWFSLKANLEGTRWEGKCWHYHENLRYQFDVSIDLPVGYPLTPPEIKIPELDRKTIKMYHGGKICLDVHFNPLWSKNSPKFGVAHALALGLGPWLAAEVPNLVQNGFITPV